MAVFNYKKFKVSIDPESKKIQGLRTGDIVRRQYQDGNNIVYTLMCVLSSGTDSITEDEVVKERHYFIGALLEGNAPQSNEILDFIRVANLFDEDRSGAIHLTATDSQSPYMDVIDGIGKNMSFCYPESIASPDFSDSTRQYIIEGSGYVEAEYIKSDNDVNRICHLTRNSDLYDGVIGLKQEFYQYVENPDRVIVSYKIKASRELYNITGTLGYSDGSRVDGEVQTEVSTEWEYKLHTITVDWSGRHLRSFVLNINDSLTEGDEVWIADFNIILQSSVGTFSNASHVRIGKMNGIVDPVFGRLSGYGGYLQKLYASKSVNISGTLTAGDENGFASTFYAGKIHRNVFVNSLDASFTSSVEKETGHSSPTGIGHIYKSNITITLIAQSEEWLNNKINKKYCFSCWIYAFNSCTINISQNGYIVGSFIVENKDTCQWIRHNVSFDLLQGTPGEKLLISLSPTFNESETEQDLFLFTAPQLESGEFATQYQPTDSILNITEDYGAWFNRGGIGGTIQNPLLQLNYDGEGSIGTRSKSLLLRQDGSGYLANRNIEWDEDGDVRFGDNVTVGWGNIDDEVKSELQTKSVSIDGTDTFMMIGDTSPDSYYCYPKSIELSAIESNVAQESDRKWYYLYNNKYHLFESETGQTITISPDGEYWNKENVLTIKYEVTANQEVFYSTITLKKLYVIGYSIELESSRGKSFKNGDCSTIINANVYYQGKLLDQDFINENFTFQWEKYTLPNIDNPVVGWWEEIIDSQGNIIQEAIDTTKQSIELNYNISGSDMYACALIAKENNNAFPYPFPVVFS